MLKVQTGQFFSCVFRGEFALFAVMSAKEYEIKVRAREIFRALHAQIALAAKRTRDPEDRIALSSVQIELADRVEALSLETDQPVVEEVTV